MSKRRIPVYVADEEHEQLRVAAAHAGLSLTEYVKRAALEKSHQDAIQRGESKGGIK